MRPIKDPLTSPVLVRVDDGKEGVVFVSNRTTEPASIIGAKIGPPCSRCGFRVWLAPSSAGVQLSTLRVLCDVCAWRTLPGFAEVALDALAHYRRRVRGEG